MSKGAIESQALVVPAGGWACHIVDASATFDATVAAGTYSPTTLAAAWLAALNAGSAEVYTLLDSFSETPGDDGHIKISATGASLAITWTSTDLRDALGYTGNLSLAQSYDADYGMKGRWLPDCPYLSPYGSADPGHTEGGPTQTVSPLGVTKTIVRPTRVKMPGIRWSHVSAARARQAAETGAPRSFERFLRETMFGAVSYFRPGGAWRFYWSADNLAVYTDFYPVAPKTTAMDAADAQWRGLYAVEFAGWKL